MLTLRTGLITTTVFQENSVIKMEITRLTKEDCHSLALLDSLCFSCPFSYNDFISYIDSPIWHIFVAKEGGEVLGYISLTLICDEGQIVNVAVFENARGRGAGKALVKKALDVCRENGAKNVFLEVRESNSVAISLYESVGFRRLGILKNHYQKPRENALSMSLSL